jgi:AbrB family transcriptional regulator, transcriptional pleiotropic regulator of transition state genes
VASSGIRRKVDDLGRVVIPASIRRSLGIREGDAVEVSVEGERVVLAKPRESCVFCGREEQALKSFRGRLLCRECLGGLGVMDERTRVSEQAAQADFPPPAPRPAATQTSPRPAAPAPPARASSAPGPSAPSTAPAPAPDVPGPAVTSEPAAPPPGDPGSAPAPRPVRAAREPRDRSGGPIDGDAWARTRARGEDAPPPRRRPPQDPASTTAW